MLYKILKIILYPIFKLIFLFKVKDRPKHIPEKNLIICANHKSLLDPILLALASKREINFMAKKELYNNKFFGYILRKLYAFPVDRGNNDIDAVRQSIKVLKQDKLLGIFPEGTRVKDSEISRENFKDGVALIATKTNSNILPVRIRGKYGLFSRVTVEFKDIIKVEDFDSTNKKNLYQNIMDKVYDSIYGN